MIKKLFAVLLLCLAGMFATQAEAVIVARAYSAPRAYVAPRPMYSAPRVVVVPRPIYTPRPVVVVRPPIVPIVPVVSPSVVVPADGQMAPAEPVIYHEDHSGFYLVMVLFILVMCGGCWSFYYYDPFAWWDYDYY